MKSLIAFILFLYSASLFICNAQSASIIFSSDKDISVDIYQPIDNAFNSLLVADRIDLKPNIEVTYKVNNISDFSFIQCRYSDGRKYIFIMQEDKTLKVHYRETDLKLEGDNASGMIYFNNNYISKGLIGYLQKINSVFQEQVKDTVDFGKIAEGLERTICDPVKNELDSLDKNGNLSAGFIEILYDNLHYAYLDMVFMNYFNLYSGRINGYKPSPSDSVIIEKNIEKLYDYGKKINSNTLKYNYGTIFRYYDYKFGNMDKKEKDNLKGEWMDDTFGPLLYYLLAPKDLHPALFGKAFLVQFEYMVEEFDKEKMMSYLETNFPQSEYIPILKKKMQDMNSAKEEETAADSVVILDNSINTLKDLAQIEDLKGKFIYIDLWATWCLPCKTEFRYNKDVEALLSNFKNIVPIYISIDDDKFEKAWKNDVKKYDLKGFNVRASSELQDDMKQKIYKGRSISIPRYVLLNPEGEIIEDDLPRPSAISLLEDALKKLSL